MARKRTKVTVKPRGSVATNARRIVAAQTVAFFAREHSLEEPAAVAELHEMRIAAKRLRYAMELFSATLGPGVGWCIDTVKEFQAIVGEIHDADVRVGMLRDYLHMRAGEQADALATLAADDPEDIDAFKTRAHATVTADTWVKEQVALTTAIARTLAGRRERFAHLRERWAIWSKAGLRPRLEALGHAPARRDAARHDDVLLSSLPTPVPASDAVVAP